MSERFRPGQRVRCTSTWTTRVVDRGSEYTVEEVDSDGTHVRVVGDWVPATYFEAIPGCEVEPVDLEQEIRSLVAQFSVEKDYDYGYGGELHKVYRVDEIEAADLISAFVRPILERAEKAEAARGRWESVALKHQEYIPKIERERNGLWNRMVALADEWTALAADLMYASVEKGEPGLHERGTTYGAAANTIRRTLTGESDG